MSRSRDTSRRSMERKRSRCPSREKRRCRSRDRKQSPIRDKRRSLSRDRRRSRERRRSRDRKSPSRSRDRRRSRERRPRSRSRPRQSWSRAMELQRKRSAERLRKKSRSPRKRSVSKKEVAAATSSLAAKLDVAASATSTPPNEPPVLPRAQSGDGTGPAVTLGMTDEPPKIKRSLAALTEICRAISDEERREYAGEVEPKTAEEVAE
ncbi:hypothetical protein MTO96_018156 [Rhipicephalus appendiculatus]